MPSSYPTTASATAQDQLRAFLADTDVHCPSCDYNLRGLTTDACPECSQRLTLRVALAEPRQRAFIAAVVGFAMGAGFQGFMAVFFVVLIAKKNVPDWRAFFMLTSSVFVIETGALITLVLRRRKFQRRSSAFRAWTVVVAWLFTIAGFVAFTRLAK
jgi:hypothetical protein